MVIERPVGPFGENAGIGSYFETPKFKVTRGGWIAIGASLALHVAAGVFIYEQRTAPAPAVVVTPDRIITADVVRLSDLTPPKPQTPPKIVPVHQALNPPTTVDKAQVVAQDKPLTLDPVGQARLADETLKPAQPQATTIATPSKVIRNPTWLEQPNADQLAQYYPARALDLGKTGAATLNCVVSAHGGLTRCSVASETPAGWGFGEAAQKLSRYFRMSPRTEDGVPVEGGTIAVVIRFKTDS